MRAKEQVGYSIRVRRGRVVARTRLWRGGAIGFGLAAILAACVSAPASRPGTVIPRTDTPAARPVVNPPTPIADYDPRSRPSPALVSIIQSLGSQFRGHVGIAVRRVDADWTISYNGSDLFPQQSVSKLWVAMNLLDNVDRGKLSLDDSITLTKADLTLFHQPTAAMIGNSGWTTTLNDLLVRAMTQSDNTANDALLRRGGGPDAVRGFLARRFIRDIRFGPGEKLLQSKTAGLNWNPNYTQGRAFYTARAALPKSVREHALDAYLADPPDGAAPNAMVAALARLKRGEMLSPRSTSLLLSIMSEAKTGPQRIKGGVPHDWSYLHKTGTGQELAPRSTGFNDVGIMTAPDGTSYAVAVMIGETTLSIPERWTLMQAVAKAIVANHDRN